MYKNKSIILLALILVGCTTTRMNQFNEFAEAGKLYVDAVEVVTEEAGNAVVDADSAVLIKAREKLEFQDRLKEVDEHNKILKERLRLLKDIRRHGRILKSYFVALANLTQSEIPEKISERTVILVESLGEISDDIKEAKIGNLAVSEFTGPATKIVVGQFRVQALEKELKDHALIITDELDLQQVVLKFIAEEMKTDLEAVLLNLEYTEIINKYSIDKSLPNDWAKKRKEILTATVSIGAVDAAFKAAKSLKEAFVALVENKFELTHLDAIITDIEEIYTLIDKIIAESETEEEE